MERCVKRGVWCVKRGVWCEERGVVCGERLWCVATAGTHIHIRQAVQREVHHWITVFLSHTDYILYAISGGTGGIILLIIVALSCVLLYACVKNSRRRRELSES